MNFRLRHLVSLTLISLQSIVPLVSASVYGPHPYWDADNNVYDLGGIPLRINSGAIIGSGNLGIGVLNPGYRVDVNGYINTNSGFCIGGSCITSWSEIGGWSFSGNTGTNPTNHFIGTTDNVDLVFKTNNIERFRFYSGATAANVIASFSGKDILVNGITIGRGSGNILTNTAIGNGALASIQPGTYSNTAVGFNALYSNTTAYNNTAIGSYTLVSNTDGINNTAIGVQSLYNNTAGWYNTANGISTLWSNTTGDYNVAIGPSALWANTTGSNHIAMGYRSAYRITSTGGAAPNIAIGHQSLYGGSATASSNTASDNIAIGYQTLYGSSGTPSTGTGNVAVGNSSLVLNTSGYNNATLGYGALYANSTGYQNTALGSMSLVNSTIGNNNIAIGYNTASDIVTGSNNTIIGANVTGLASNLSNNIIIADGSGNRRINVGSTGNVGIGTNTGNYLLDVAGTGAFQNIRISSGAIAGYVLTSDTSGNATWQTLNNKSWSLSGNSGTNPLTQFIGTTDNQDIVFKRNNIESFRLSGASGNLVTTADASINGVTVGRGKNNNIANTAIGNQALYNNTTGFNNTALGLWALLANTTGNNNVANGTFALSNLSTGTGNTAIGANAMPNSLGGDYNTVLGYNTALGITTGIANTIIGANVTGLASNLSNNIIIADGSGNRRINVSSSGAVGIGTNTPGYKLDVAGTGAFQNIRISSGATAGYVLTSDASGNATWQALSNSLPNATSTGNTLRWTGTGWSDSNNKDILVNGITIGRGTGAITGNLMVGINSFSANITGVFNTALGDSALQKNTDGGVNVALGHESLRENTSGNYNTAVGAGSLKQNVLGYDNVAIGANTLGDNLNGNQNVAIGYATLRRSSGNNNIGIGADSLWDLHYGNKNIVIGSASTVVGSGSNNILIGNELGTASGSNNILNIGGWILGSNGYISIGTGTSSFRLDVGNGYINSASGFCINGDCKNSWTPDGKNEQYLKKILIYGGEKDGIIRTSSQTEKSIKIIDGDLMNFSSIICPSGTEILGDFFVTYTDNITNGGNPNISLKYSDNNTISLGLSAFNMDQGKYKTIIHKVTDSSIRENNTDDVTLLMSVFMGNETTEYFELIKVELGIYCGIAINGN